MEKYQIKKQSNGSAALAGLFFVSILFLLSLAFNIWFLCKKESAKAKPAVKAESVVSPKMAPVAVKIPKKSFYADKQIPLLLKSTKYDMSKVTMEFYCAGELIAHTAHLQCTPSVKNAKLSASGNKLIFYGNFQAGKTYKITVKKNLRDSKNNILNDDAVIEATIKDRSPELNFAVKGLYLQAKPGPIVLPFQMVNLQAVTVSIRRAYNNNLNPYYDNWAEDSKMVPVVEKNLFFKNIPKNQDVFQELNLTRLLGGNLPGIYQVTLSPPPHSDACSASCKVIVTDIGVQAVLDSFHSQILVHTASLHLNKPLPDVEITVWSAKNQLVAKGISNSQGAALLKFNPSWISKEDRVVAVMARRNSDLCYFRLDEPHNYAQEPELDEFRAKVFLFTERGICRPGESFTVSGFARFPLQGTSYTAPLKSAPVCYTLISPSGEVVDTFEGITDSQGFFRAKIQLPPLARTGLWRINAKLERSKKICGKTDILVGSYVPDALKVTGRCLTKSSKPDQPVDFQFDARYYFGAPLLSGTFRYSITPRHAPRPKHWDSSWQVGFPDVSPCCKDWRDSLPHHGKAQLITFPGWNKSNGLSTLPVLLSANVSFSVPGGRSVSSSAETVIHPYSQYIGLREGSNKESIFGNYEMECALLPAEKGVLAGEKAVQTIVSLTRMEWEYVLKKNGSTYQREWECRQYRLDERTIHKTLHQGVIEKICWKKLPAGLYSAVITASTGQTSYMEFWHSAGSGGGHPIDRNRLVFNCDKPVYLPGEKVSFNFSSPGDGNAKIVCGEDRIALYGSIEVKKGKNQFSFTLPERLRSSSFFAGVTVVTYDASGELLRLFGILELKIDQKSNKLKVALDMPSVAVPGAKIPVTVRLTDAKGKGQGGAVAIYGVDSGIISLTNYRCPDIFNFFHGKQKHPFSFYDLYGKIYPRLKLSANGKIGGDAVAESKLIQLKQKESVRLILPLIQVPASGVLKTRVVMPDHNGAMNFYAVAVSEKTVGSAETEIILRKKLSVRLNAPQFLTPNDQCEVTVSLFNHDESASNGSCRLILPPQLAPVSGEKLKMDGIILRKGEQKTLKFRLQGKELYGAGLLKVEYSCGKTKVTSSEYLTIRAPFAAETRSRIHLLRPGESLKLVPGQNFIGKSKTVLRLSNTAATGVPGALEWLNRYPYGCLEQTVAAAFPLLYTEELQKAKLVDPRTAATAGKKIALVYRSILAMSLESGGFGMWEFDRTPWHSGSIFAIHFIIEAAKRHLILLDSDQKQTYTGYLEKIQDSSFHLSREERAAAAYVLALAGSRSAAGFAHTILLESEKPDYAMFLAGAALVQSKYSADGSAAMRESLKAGCWHPASGDSEDRARHLGMTLKILHDCCWTDRVLMTRIALQLSKMQKQNGSGWGTTNANAWATAGLALYAANEPPQKTMVEFQNRRFEISGIREFHPESPFEIKNCSGGTLIVEWKELGVPRTPEAPGLIRISRVYRTKSGKPVETVSHGDLLTVEINITSPVEVDDLVIADLLPGGLEIEDFRLSGKSAILREKVSNLTVNRLEKRPDRFLLFGAVQAGKKATFTYNVRAVSCGRFKIPPVTAESMYHPDLKGSSPVLPQDLIIR